MTFLKSQIFSTLDSMLLNRRCGRVSPPPATPDARHKLNIHSLPQSGASEGQWLPGDWVGAGVAACYCRYCHIYHSRGNYGKS